MTAHISKEPLPCPWCGEKPRVQRDGSIWELACANIDCQIAIVLVQANTEADAICRWNERKP